MKNVAARVARLHTSVFSEFAALAVANRAVNLSQGYPNFDGPEEIKKVARQAIQDGSNQYSLSSGLLDLRSAIAEHAARFYGMKADPEAMVTVTAGATEAIFIAVLGLVEHGDEVLLFEPFYDAYLGGIAMTGGTPRFVTLHPPNEGHHSWWFDPDELARAFTPRTKLLILNSPHNPTGKVFTREELLVIGELCREHDCFVLSDEVYEHLVYEPMKHIPIASLSGMSDRTITVSSGSKSFSVTGWRTGWAIAPPEISRSIQCAHQVVTGPTATPFQIAMAAALRLPDGYFFDLQSSYRSKREQLISILKDVGLRPLVPEGAFFAIADTSDFDFPDDYAFCRWLTTEIGVSALPTSAFYAEPSKAQAHRQARFTFCKTSAMLKAAAMRLSRVRSGSAAKVT